jgi:hypothetical protein
LLVAVKPTEAEDRLRTLLTSMGPDELRVWEPDFRLTIAKFLPKRRRNLDTLLNELLAAGPSDGRNKAETVTAADVDIWPVVRSLESDLEELSGLHIFQWSTFYRDYLGQFFTEFIDASASAQLKEASESVKDLFSNHTREIFTKGYYYVTRYDTSQHAFVKSISGLQHLLDLPVEFYSVRLSADLELTKSLGLRELNSSMLCGIIEGYAGLQFDTISGKQLLSENARAWGHVLAFMSARHLTEVLDLTQVDDFNIGVRAAVLPLSATLDKLTKQATSYSPLPALSQLIWPQRRLEVSLRTPPYAPDRRPVTIQCYLDPDLIAADLLTEAAGREIAAVVAPLRPDLRAILADDNRLGGMVVPVLEDVADSASTSARLERILEDAIYRRRSPRLTSQPIEYNFAREFPLTNPFLTRYYYVYRTSVRELLRTFERRNGVRLWCSVRRSGKTTAGLDLGTTTGQSNVISQTCDSTGQIADGSLLYDTICGALGEGMQLRSDFFAHIIRRCMPSGQAPEHRTVLVLDEYETLFGQLSTAVSHDLRLRYTVVQPLLNQMVAFTRDNLLVFLGQQPTAHYILMDQNQLSAYVEQDTFPLFSHGDKHGDEEFTELLRKILSNRVQFDKSFVDRVFIETQGHPYLTVNMMVEFVDWLIKTKRPANQLQLTGEDVSMFAARMFRRDSISVSSEYRFFRDAAIRQALSANSRRQNPWLYAVYSVMRVIVRDNPDTYTCSRNEFVDIVQNLGLEEIGITADYLLTTGTQANFLTYSSRSVAPKIRLLGRIAAVATPEVNP